MAFDGEAFVDRFNTVWNGHDIEGILAMMTDDVIFEASFGKDPWGSRVVGKPAVGEFLEEMFERVADIRWDEIRHFACPELAVVEWLTTATPRGSRFRSASACRPRSWRSCSCTRCSASARSVWISASPIAGTEPCSRSR